LNKFVKEAISEIQYKKSWSILREILTAVIQPFVMDRYKQFQCVALFFDEKYFTRKTTKVIIPIRYGILLEYSFFFNEPIAPKILAIPLRTEEIASRFIVASTNVVLFLCFYFRLQRLSQQTS